MPEARHRRGEQDAALALDRHPVGAHLPPRAASDRAGIISTGYLFCLFYQVEITYRHLPQKRTAHPIVGCDCRGSTIRLWQPHG